MSAVPNTRTLYRDITEAVAQVFDGVCSAVVAQGCTVPVHCAGNQDVGRRLPQLPLVQAALTDGRSTTATFGHDDPSAEPYAVGVVPLRPLSGNTAAVFVCVTLKTDELTRAMALVEALAREAGWHQDLLSESPAMAEVLAEVDCGVTIADLTLDDAPLVFVNNAFEQMTGYSRAEALGRNCRFLQGSLRDQPGIAVIREAINRGESCTAVLTNFRRNGEPFRNKLNLRPVRTGDGALTHMIGIQNNVTEEQEALESLDLQRRRYQSLIEAGASHVWQMSATGELLSVDPSWLALAGLAPAEHPPSWEHIRAALTPEASAAFRRHWAEALEHTRSFEVIYSLPAGSSTPRWFQDRVSPIRDDAGRLLEWFGVSREITALKNAEQDLERIIQAAPIGMLVVDTVGVITLANAQASQLFGYPVRALEGMVIESLVPASLRDCHQGLRAGFSASPSTRRMGVNREVRALRKDGTEFNAEIGLSLFGEDGNLRVVAAINDTTELYSAREAAENAAYQDRLTGLLSREGFERHLQDRIDADGWQSRGLVLTVDLPGHRDVNDAYGFASGDRLISQFGSRLENQVGDRGLLARIARSEFAVFILPEQDAPATASLERLSDALSDPFQLNGGDIEMSFRLGYTQCGENQRPVAELLREAERALSQHHKNESLPWVAYSNHLQEEARQRLELTRELRQALSDDQLELHFQPKVDLVSGTLIACEALVRWNHPVRGLISPGVFIPAAEQSQLIIPIGDWVLRRACQHLRDWRDAGLNPVRVAVNVSVVQFQVADFASRVRAILDESGVAPGELALEITESVFEQESDKLLAQMSTLRDMGVWLSLDDFGTGYSSLLYLQRYPFDEIKIDQGFVFRMLDDAFSRNIVSTVLKLAEALSAEIIAEGIESAEVSRALVEMGCHFGQGFFYSMPLEAEDFRWLLEQRSKLPINAGTTY